MIDLFAERIFSPTHGPTFCDRLGQSRFPCGANISKSATTGSPRLSGATSSLKDPRIIPRSSEPVMPFVAPSSLKAFFLTRGPQGGNEADKVEGLDGRHMLLASAGSPMGRLIPVLKTRCCPIRGAESRN